MLRPGTGLKRATNTSKRMCLVRYPIHCDCGSQAVTEKAMGLSPIRRRQLTQTISGRRSGPVLVPRRGGDENYGLRATAELDVSPNFTLQLKGGISSVVDGGATDLVERVCGSGRTTPLSANGRPPSPNADCVVNGRSDQSSIPVEVAQAGYRYARDGRMYADFKSQYVVLAANVTSDPFDVSSITGYTHFRQEDLNNVSGEAYPATFTQFVDFKQFSQELRFQSKFSGPFNVLFGGYYAHGERSSSTQMRTYCQYQLIRS